MKNPEKDLCFQREFQINRLMIGIGESVQPLVSAVRGDISPKRNIDVFGYDEAVDGADVRFFRNPFDIVVPAGRKRIVGDDFVSFRQRRGAVFGKEVGNPVGRFFAHGKRTVFFVVTVFRIISQQVVVEISADNDIIALIAALFQEIVQFFHLFFSDYAVFVVCRHMRIDDVKRFSVFAGDGGDAETAIQVEEFGE